MWTTPPIPATPSTSCSSTCPTTTARWASGNLLPRLLHLGLQLIDSHPALVAASPQAPMTDPFLGDDGYHGGAFMLSANFGFYSFFHPQNGPRTPCKLNRPFQLRYVRSDCMVCAYRRIFPSQDSTICSLPRHRPATDHRSPAHAAHGSVGDGASDQVDVGRESVVRVKVKPELIIRESTGPVGKTSAASSKDAAPASHGARRQNRIRGSRLSGPRSFV